VLLVVADSINSHRAGETASRVTVDTVGEVFGAATDPPEETLRTALETANARVHEMAVADPELRGMGTTAVALLIGPADTAHVAHVGDSRLYRYRGDALRPLTRDHSVVAELERRGLLSSEEAAVHPRRNEIMRSIGVEATVEVDVQRVDLRSGDRYLLCSDGLSGLVDETEIAVILEGAEPAEAARQLVDRANEHGGHDNVTVQIALIDDPGATEPGADGERAAPAGSPASAGAQEAAHRPAGRRPDLRRKRRALMAVAFLLALLAAGLIVWLVQLRGAGTPAAGPEPGAASPGAPVDPASPAAG